MRIAKKLIDEAKHIFVLTGAGVSTDSGIPDFQTADKTWKYEIPRAEAMSIWFFNDNPQRFWEIYRETFIEKRESRPNCFHYFLSSLQNNHKVTIATQNVDGLHKSAGSKEVIECHGNIKEVICIRRDCLKTYTYDELPIDSMPRCAACNNVLKPNVSLFGEGVQGFGEARDIMVESNLLIVAGTSLNVGPINELPTLCQYFAPHVKRLWINGTPPPEDYSFTHELVTTFENFIDGYGK